MTEKANLFENLQLQGEAESSLDGELLYEMATIGSKDELGLKQISVNPSSGNDVYFKVLIDTKKGLKMGRFDMKNNRLLVHNQDRRGYKPLTSNELTSEIITNIKTFMSEKYVNNNRYTNWDATKYYWNLELNSIPYNTSLEEYMSGKFDNEENYRYVSSKQKIPVTWK